MIAGIALFSMLNGVVKAQMEIFPANQVVFFRNVFSLAPLLLILRAGGGAFRTARPGLHVLLSVMFTAGLLCIFVSYTMMPLAEATAINFTQPLMIIAFSLVLGFEKVRRAEIVAVGLGFLGVLLMVRPGGGEGIALLGAGFGLTGAALSAGAMITQRKLSMTDGSSLIAFCSLGLSVPMLAPTLIFSWVTPTFVEFAGLAAMGIASGLCQYLIVRASYHASASSLSSITYSKMFWAIVIGYVWFAEIPSLGVLLGSGVIVASTLILFRDSRGASRRPAA